MKEFIKMTSAILTILYGFLYIMSYVYMFLVDTKVGNFITIILFVIMWFAVGFAVFMPAKEE